MPSSTALTGYHFLNNEETLARTLDLITALVGAARSGVILVDEETGELHPTALRPERKIAPDDLAQMLVACQSVIASGKMMYVAPNPAEGLYEPGALVPLTSRGVALGVLVIIGPQGGEFSKARLALFQSIADQLSIAIENARLFRQHEQAAVAAERNRLARDLHDAVIQTLFSSSMIAEYPLNNPGRRRSQTAFELAPRGSVTPVAPTY